MSKLRGSRPPVFDLTHIDGDIIVAGHEHARVQGPHSAVRITRAEALQFVRFAALLWPDQVTRIIGDVHSELIHAGLPQAQRAPGQRVHQPEKAAEEDQAADLHDLRVRGQHPQQQTEDGEDERPDRDQHVPTVSPLILVFSIHCDQVHAVQSFIVGGDGEAWSWCGMKVEGPRLQYIARADLECRECRRRLALPQYEGREFTVTRTLAAPGPSPFFRRDAEVAVCAATTIAPMPGPTRPMVTCHLPPNHLGDHVAVNPATGKLHAWPPAATPPTGDEELELPPELDGGKS